MSSQRRQERLEIKISCAQTLCRQFNDTAAKNRTRFSSVCLLPVGEICSLGPFFSILSLSLFLFLLIFRCQRRRCFSPGRIIPCMSGAVAGPSATPSGTQIHRAAPHAIILSVLHRTICRRRRRRSVSDIAASENPDEHEEPSGQSTSAAGARKVTREAPSSWLLLFTLWPAVRPSVRVCSSRPAPLGFAAAARWFPSKKPARPAGQLSETERQHKALQTNNQSNGTSRAELGRTEMKRNESTKEQQKIVAACERILSDFQPQPQNHAQSDGWK